MDKTAYSNMANAYFSNIPLTLYLPDTEENLEGQYSISETDLGILVTISAAYQPTNSSIINEIQVLEKLSTVPTLYSVTWVSIDTCTLSPSPAGLVSIGDRFDIDGNEYEVSAITGDDVTFTTPVSSVSVFYASVASPDVTYQWELSEDGGNTWTVIPGATSRSYAPVSGDVGDNLRVIVSYVDGQGTVEQPTLAPPESQPLIITPIFPVIADISLDLSRVYQPNVLASLVVSLEFN